MCYSLFYLFTLFILSNLVNNIFITFISFMQKKTQMEYFLVDGGVGIPLLEYIIIVLLLYLITLDSTLKIIILKALLLGI